VVDAPSGGARPAKPRSETAAERPTIAADPRVQAVLDIFGGSVTPPVAPTQANDTNDANDAMNANGADDGETAAPPRAANDPGVARDLPEENEEPE